MMQKKLVLLLMMTFCALHMSAQGKFNPEQFRAQLHKCMIAEAHLTQEEAEKFFPVYDEMKEKQRVLFEQMKSLRHQRPGSDAACKSAIIKRDKLDMQIKQLESSYHKRFLNMLSPTKVYDLLKAEGRFHRETFRKMAKKRN